MQAKGMAETKENNGIVFMGQTEPLLAKRRSESEKLAGNTEERD